MAIIIVIVEIGCLLLISTGRIHRRRGLGLESPVESIQPDYSLTPEEQIAVNWFRANCYIVTAQMLNGEEYYVMDLHHHAAVGKINPDTLMVEKVRRVRQTRRA